MQAITKLLTEALARPHSRLRWLAIGGGAACGLALHLCLFALARNAGAAGPAFSFLLAQERAMAMLYATLASFSGAAVAGSLARRAASEHIALNAYAGWAVTSLVLMLNVALTTDALHS
jgi:hypothetical protein